MLQSGLRLGRCVLAQSPFRSICRNSGSIIAPIYDQSREAPHIRRRFRRKSKRNASEPAARLFPQVARTHANTNTPRLNIQYERDGGSKPAVDRVISQESSLAISGAGRGTT